MTRTIEQSLARAQNLRDFRFTSPKAFERSDDFRDIVNLFEEIERLRSEGVKSALEVGEEMGNLYKERDRLLQIEDDHHESW